MIDLPFEWFLAGVLVGWCLSKFWVPKKTNDGFELDSDA